MTAKQLLAKLQQEKFDVKDFDVTVSTGDEEFEVTGIELDNDNRQIRLLLNDSDES